MTVQNNILIYFDILTSLRTVEDLNQISSEIDNLLASIFETDDQSFDKALKSISVDTAKKINDAINKNGLNITNKELIRNFLEGLKKLLGKFKTIRLIISIEPSSSAIENIHNWVISNLGEGYLLEIETNHNLLGGAIIEFDGKYRDFTVKKNLENLFLSKKEEILL